MEYGKSQATLAGRIGDVGGNSARQSTLAERLERANNVLYVQTDRVMSFIGRVNGTPGQPQPEQNAKIAAVAPLAQSVEATEALGKRLADLAEGLERIG